MSAAAFKSPPSRLFTQPYVQAHIKVNIELDVTGFCEGNSLVVGEFPENDSGAKMFPFDDVIMKLML